MKTINSFRSKLFALTLALMASVSSYAKDGYPDFQVDELYYNFLEGDSVQVTFLMPPAIPTEVAADASNKKNVSGAGYGHLTEIVIPSTVIYEDKTYHVTRIGHGAFMYCPNLMHIDLPTSIKSIGKGAFHNCRYLSSITLNEGLESIEQQAFYDCVRLKEVTLPSTLKTMGQGIFYFSTDLEKVTCKAIVPPTVEKDVLTATDNYNASIIPNATLYVPASSLTTYQNTYPWNTFGQILSIEDSLQNIFPTLAGLQRTHTIEMYDHAPNDGKRSGGYPLPFASVKDTVINGKTYLQFGDHVNGSNYSLFFLREENNKVLIYSSILQNDLVLYDYTLELGDSLPAITSDHDYFSDDHFTKLDKAENIFTYVVTDVSTVTLLDGIERKKWILKNKYLPIIEYVEGIGCYGENTSDSGDFFRLIHDHPYTTEYVGDHLVCVSKNGQLLYSMPQEEMNSFTLTCECLSQEDTIAPKDLFPTLWGLQRTSCSEYVDCQENETYLMQADEIKEINGKLYLKYGGVFLREEDSKVLIYSFPYEKDFVLYDWTLEIGDTLPNLGIDPFSFPELEYTAVVDYVAFEEYDENGNRTIVKNPLGNKRVKDISTMRLLDGNEYKAWLFGYDWERGGYYVEGIGNASKYGGDYVELAHPFDVPTCYYGERLVCVSRDGVLLYQIDDAEMERLGTECLCEVETSYKSQWCDTWNVMEHDMGMTSDTEKTWRHYLANDTIINGQTYTSVNYYWTLEESKVYKIAHVRFSEDKKVYALMDDTEYLVYDFSVQVGDTIETIVGVGYGSMLQQLLVHQIDIDGATNRKTITLYPICRIEDDEYDEDWVYLWDCCPVQWIEGVGSTDGFLMGYPPCDWVGGIGCDLLCAYKDDELKYTGELYDEYGCEYNATEQKPEDLFPTLWGLQRTSCTKTIGEDEYGTVWGSRSYLMQETQTTTIDGKQYMVFGDDQYNRFALREENNKILVYSSILKKDLVLYDFTLEVGDSLPALYFEERAHDTMQQWLYIGDIVDYNKDDDGTILPAETFVVTDISTITLLDGKEYKKWTFDNGMEYVEGIGSFGTSYAWNDFYQLIANGPLYSDVHSQHLVCASKNNKLLYQMEDAEMERLGAECLCDYDRGPRKDNAKNGKIGGRPTPTQWNMLEVETKEMDGTPTIVRAETFSYTLENDSIVAKGKTFYQLARQSTKDTAITKSFVGALHFGEDEDNRVYFLRDGVEYVLYDFTAEPGDTIEIFAGINNYPLDTTYTHVVVDKDTTEDGACRMFLEVVFPDETSSVENAEKVWLAGLGSIDGIVHNAAKRTSDVHAAPRRSASSETQTSVMLCAWRDDNCLYTTNHPEYDTFGCVYNQDPTAVEDVQTSGDKYQKIIRDGHLYILRDNKLYDVLGTPMN